MPTGYTEVILEGQNFKEFIRECSKAFIRDYDKQVEYYLDSLIHYNESIKDDKQQLDILEKLKKDDPKQFEYLGNLERQQAIEDNKDWIRSNKEKRKIYEKMLVTVEKWHPPEDLQTLKDFAINQIESSIEFDCVDDYFEEKLRKDISKEACDYAEDRIRLLKTSIENSLEQIIEDSKRLEEIKDFKSKLEESLEGFDYD